MLTTKIYYSLKLTTTTESNSWAIHICVFGDQKRERKKNWFWNSERQQARERINISLGSGSSSFPSWWSSSTLSMDVNHHQHHHCRKLWRQSTWKFPIGIIFIESIGFYDDIDDVNVDVDEDDDDVNDEKWRKIIHRISFLHSFIHFY